MDYESAIKIKLRVPLTENDIKIINSKINTYPDKTFIIEIPNTRGISSDFLKRLSPRVAIRVEGGYSDEYINRIFSASSQGLEYKKAFTYSRNELINIIGEMEKIESGINPFWDEATKTIYIYDKIRNSIMYDANAKEENKTSRDIRSLRGLSSKKTVCAGFAIIFKEMLNRQGIKCRYVSGGKHAWNIVMIDNKLYPFDLTWDNNRYTHGVFNSYSFLGQDPESFNKRHITNKNDPSYGLEKNFSELDSNMIRRVLFSLNTNRDFDNILKIKRDDGSKFFLAQIGSCEIDNVMYYRYYFLEYNNGKVGRPMLLYSSTNVQGVIDAEKFKRSVPKGAKHAIANVLFSRENINDSMSKNTNYIGNVVKKKEGNTPTFVTSPSEIKKKEELCKQFSYNSKLFMRNDGSFFLAERVQNGPKFNGKDIFCYDILEFTSFAGKGLLRKNRIYSDEDIFKDGRDIIPNDLLSRARLDRKVRETGGYVGYCDERGYRTSRLDVANRIKYLMETNPSGNKDNYTKVDIPSFEEARELVKKYRFSSTLYDIFPAKDFKLFSVDTGEEVKNINPVTEKKAIYANIWLRAAGAKVYPHPKDPVPGFSYAFCEDVKIIYDEFVKACDNSVARHYYVDSTEVFKTLYEHPECSLYKYNNKIAAEMFLNSEYADFINRLFQEKYSIGFSPNDTLPLETEQKAIYNYLQSKNSKGA